MLMNRQDILTALAGHGLTPDATQNPDVIQVHDLSTCHAIALCPTDNGQAWGVVYGCWDLVGEPDWRHDWVPMTSDRVDVITTWEDLDWVLWWVAGTD